jgi:hypothetical protein
VGEYERSDQKGSIFFLPVAQLSDWLLYSILLLFQYVLIGNSAAHELRPQQLEPFTVFFESNGLPRYARFHRCSCDG